MPEVQDDSQDTPINHPHVSDPGPKRAYSTPEKPVAPVESVAGITLDALPKEKRALAIYLERVTAPMRDKIPPIVYPSLKAKAIMDILSAHNGTLNARILLALREVAEVCIGEPIPEPIPTTGYRLNKHCVIVPSGGNPDGHDYPLEIPICIFTESDTRGHCVTVNGYNGQCITFRPGSCRVATQAEVLNFVAHCDLAAALLALGIVII